MLLHFTLFNLLSLDQYLNKIDQNVPIFSAWRAQINSNMNYQNITEKTVMTYEISSTK